MQHLEKLARLVIIFTEAVYNQLLNRVDKVAIFKHKFSFDFVLLGSDYTLM
jgi:hypothetical protein